MGRARPRLDVSDFFDLLEHAEMNGMNARVAGVCLPINDFSSGEGASAQCLSLPRRLGLNYEGS